MLPTHFSLSQQALLAALFTIGLCASTEVAAQSTPQNRTDQSSSSATDSSRDSLEEVVVTATKREVALQKLPEAVTAITSEQLDQLNAQTFEDYFRTVPGLMMNQAPGTTRNFDFSLR